MPRDGPMPSRAEVRANQEAGERPPIVVRGVVINMDGEGLRCFYNSLVAGMREIGHPRAGELSSVDVVRRHLSAFLRGPLAPLVRVGTGFEPLQEVARREGKTLAAMATDVLRDGERGMGGTVVAAVASAALSINFYTYERLGVGRFRMVESATQLAPTVPASTIHLAHRFERGSGHYDLLRLTSPMPALPPLETAAAEERAAAMQAWGRASKAQQKAATDKCEREECAREESCAKATAAAEKAAAEKAAAEKAAAEKAAADKAALKQQRAEEAARRREAQKEALEQERQRAVAERATHWAQEQRTAITTAAAEAQHAKEAARKAEADAHAAATEKAAALAQAAKAEVQLRSSTHRGRGGIPSIGRLASVALLTLMATGWVCLRGAYTCPHEMASAAKASSFEKIFNGQAECDKPQRFMGTGDWAQGMTSSITGLLVRAHTAPHALPSLSTNACGTLPPCSPSDVLASLQHLPCLALICAQDDTGLLLCPDGRERVVNDCYCLKSISCLPNGADAVTPSASDAAAVLGRQPLHSDAPDPEEPGGPRAEDLPPGSKPLSVIVAIEPDTKLWLFPDGCDHPESALLVELAVGNALVWNMDFVHAGAGYAVVHHRIHAYVDVPDDLYVRKRGETNPCTRRRLFPDGKRTRADDESASGVLVAAAARPRKKPRIALNAKPIVDGDAQLTAASFSRGKADGAGDCVILSALAGFELPPTEAANPSAATLALVQALRNCAVEHVIKAATSEEGLECGRLPETRDEIVHLMAPWRELGYWAAADARSSAAFHWGLAACLQRPLLIFTRLGRRGVAATGSVYDACVSSNCYEQAPFALILQRARDEGGSLLEWNGRDHFVPWLSADGATGIDAARRQLELRLQTLQAANQQAANQEATSQQAATERIIDDSTLEDVAKAARERREAAAARKAAEHADAVAKAAAAANAKKLAAAAAAERKHELALAAALRRREQLRSPASSSGVASGHSSPSLRPDELSDGANSEDEAAFCTANPLGLVESDDDENEVDRLTADADVEPTATEAATSSDGESGDENQVEPERLEPPDRLTKKHLFAKFALTWPKAVYVLLSVVGNGVSTRPCMLSLAARVADPHGLLSAATEPHFHECVRLPEGATTQVDTVHGRPFEQVQQGALNFAEVGGHWRRWLEKMLAGAHASTHVVLASWGGYEWATLLSSELHLHGLDLPIDIQCVSIVDIADATRKLKPFAVSVDAGLPAIASHVATEYADRLVTSATGKEALRGMLALGDVNDALHEPTTEPLLLSAIVHDLATRSGSGKGMAVVGRDKKCMLQLVPFWEYGRDLAAYIDQQANDPPPRPWKAGPPPCTEQGARLPFHAKPGCSEEGGPSALLKAAAGVDGDAAAELPEPGVDGVNGDPNETVRDLMLHIFHFFFPEPTIKDDDTVDDGNVLQRIVDATNEKAMELVVRERAKGPFRAATKDDPLDLNNRAHGPHARHRAPDLVTQSLTVDELLVYLGIRILLGAYNPDVLDYCWSSTEGWRVPEIADSMKLDRFKAINYQLSFIMADDDSNLEGRNANIRKIFDVSSWLSQERMP